jgi:chlorobactene glucosyltransferase
LIRYVTQDLAVHLIYFQVVVLAILLSNLFLLHRARRYDAPGELPFVSLLVPARDEEDNIGACVRSLLAQDYPRFEVLVLDDQSTDGTPVVLAGLTAVHPKLGVLTSAAAPEAGAGKNRACSRLAREAAGDLLFFTDADTVHAPHALRALVAALAGEDADLVTGFPRQRVVTWGERLLVPFFSWASLSFAPLWLAYRLRLPALVVACGQVMLFRREAYEAIGGHEALGTAVVEDLKLARRIRASGRRWRVVSVSDLISSRMYRSGREAVDGFTKNLFAAFDHRLLVYVFVFGWMVVLFEVPLATLLAVVVTGAQLAAAYTLFGCIGLSLALWLLPYREIGVPLYLASLYPATILANVLVAARSLLFTMSGRVTWKGRPLARPRWRWL